MFATKVSENADYGGYANWEEICADTVTIDYVSGTGSAAGVNISTDGKTAMAHADDGFYAVIGDTGSGKTCDVVIPYIYNNSIAGNSMVITDIKGDIYKTIRRTLEKNGYRIILLNFREPGCGDCFNPEKEIMDDFKAGNIGKAMRKQTDLADGFMQSVKSEKDPFWHTTAAMYFSGLERTLMENFDEEDVTIANALELHLQGDRKLGPSTYMKSFYADNENSDAWKLMASTVTAPNETRSSIHSVFVSAINKLICQDPAVIRMLSKSSFEIKDLVNEKMAVFIIADEQTLSVYSYLLSALIHQWYSKLVEIADETTGTLSRKVVFVLDEFGNLPAIKDFHIKMSLSRARGISWMLVLQSFAQLEINYGKKQAETIVGNISNWIYLHSPDPSLLKYLSSVSGETTDEFTHLKFPLLSVNQLKYFKKINKEGLTECLMLLGRKHPFIAYLPDISRYYGIEPLERIDIPLREEHEIKAIDFPSIVEAKEKEKVKKLLEKNGPREAAVKDVQMHKEKARKETAERIVALMDVVLDELNGG